MNYALAKELKEAGFPQTGNGEFIDAIGIGPVLGNNDVYVPTLSELIEACGEPITLWIMSNRTDAQKGGTEIMETGTTPEEAVARLWLALNKK